MKRLRNKHGMTMAEMLIVIAIIVVLAAVAFISVIAYQRSMGQLERDGIAKEIFVAAQNHLTAAQGEGYLGLSDSRFGTEEQSDTDVYYIVVNGRDVVNLEDQEEEQESILDQMLPFGSIDETVLAGGSYIIRYQKDTGLVLDVFYCTASGTRFDYDLQHAKYLGDVDGLITGYQGEDRVKKERRRDYTDGSILGWYGGEGTASKTNFEFVPPTMEIHNAEKLYVTVTDNMRSAPEGFTYSYVLVVTGKSSGAKKAFSLDSISNGAALEDVILDDITNPGMHFKELIADSGTFIPGEDLGIRVECRTSAPAKITYQPEDRTNSLFDSIDDMDEIPGIKETAYIRNIRHLENLDKRISGLSDTEDITVAGNIQERFMIVAAEQKEDFSWNTFKSKTGGADTIILAASGEALTDKGFYYPINPSNDYLNYQRLTYNGGSHSILDVIVQPKDGIVTAAGLFSDTTTVQEIKNLMLVDFSINGSTTAGTLAGSLTECTVTNVLTYQVDPDSAIKAVTAPTAGGLIGSVNGGKVEYSAAAVAVNGSENAGGLIGTTSDAVTVSGCYSGGHVEDVTENGNVIGVRYSTDNYDVTGATAGGLIGDAGDATIENSYSTCSVSGTSKAGGFVGTASGTITNCYATGLMKMNDVSTEDDHTANETVGAFAGTLTGTATNCKFYSIVNEVKRQETKDGATVRVLDHYLEPVGYQSVDEITALDLNTASYNDFVGAWAGWNPAKPYNRTLDTYYSKKYCLRTVDELIGGNNPPTGSGYNKWSELFVYTHYGDWPSPETFFINTR